MLLLLLLKLRLLLLQVRRLLVCCSCCSCCHGHRWWGGGGGRRRYRQDLLVLQGGFRHFADGIVDNFKLRLLRMLLLGLRLLLQLLLLFLQMNMIDRRRRGRDLGEADVLLLELLLLPVLRVRRLLRRRCRLGDDRLDTRDIDTAQRGPIAAARAFQHNSFHTLTDGRKPFQKQRMTAHILVRTFRDPGKAPEI